MSILATARALRPNLEPTQAQEVGMSTLIPISIVPNVEVHEISVDEWRVRDSSKPANDATSLLGFVLSVDGIFEAVRMGMPTARFYYVSLDEAVAALASPLSP
jgi:hypothetical protein